MRKLLIGSLCIALGSTSVSALTIGSDKLTNTNPYSSSVVSASSSRKQTDWDSNINNDSKLATIDRRVSEITGQAQAINGGASSGISLAEQISNLALEVDKATLASASALSLSQSIADQQAAEAAAALLAQQQAEAAAEAAAAQQALQAQINSCNSRGSFTRDTESRGDVSRWNYSWVWNGSACVARRGSKVF